MASLVDPSHGQKRKREDPTHIHRGHRSRHNQSQESNNFRRTNQPWNRSDQAKINQIQEEEQHREYLAQEGNFVLKQKRKAAEIRAKEGRAQPIDWLTIMLRIIDPTRDLINDEDEEDDFDLVAPESVFDGLLEDDLRSLEKGIKDFIDLERNSKNREYWQTMGVICRDRRNKLKPHGTQGRIVGSVSADIDQLLGPKSLGELEKLEKQIRKKLDSNEPIDTDYWQQLLSDLLVYKAKAKLKTIYQTVIETKLKRLREENERLAQEARQALDLSTPIDPATIQGQQAAPLLQLDSKDKQQSGIIDEREFLDKIERDRQRILAMQYVPLQHRGSGRSDQTQKDPFSSSQSGQRIAHGDPQTSLSLFEREVAKGVEEDEEVFAGEEEVETNNKDLWTSKYRPRKPKYFNRVQMGYEWNKYNQTHYDHDNPPPKVVQGYKFHIFYPDLIDITKAPTYKITREGGRKKGQTVAPAGEEDTCVIRFISGPPYEDIAFRIIDRDWDYSAKHDRGFRSTFENGVLTLHFSFKKVYYRK